MRTTTADRDPAAYKKLQELVRDIDVAMMTTVTPDGTLHSRPMVTAGFDADGEIWFFSSDDSGKAHDLEQEHAVNLSYAAPGRQLYVSISGNATIIHDRDRAEQLWRNDLAQFLPHGLEDPHLALIRVAIDVADFWDFHGSVSHGGTPAASAAKRQADGGDRDVHTRVEVRNTPASG